MAQITKLEPCKLRYLCLEARAELQNCESLRNLLSRASWCASSSLASPPVGHQGGWLDVRLASQPAPSRLSSYFLLARGAGSSREWYGRKEFVHECGLKSGQRERMRQPASLTATLSLPLLYQSHSLTLSSHEICNLPFASASI